MKYYPIYRPLGTGLRVVLLLAILLLSFGPGGKGTAYAAPPLHDDFDDARLITGIEYHNSDDTSEATPSDTTPNVDDPDDIDCEGDILNAGFASVWYEYTPTVNQSLTLNTIGSDYDTFIAVWTGTRGNLDLVACNDDTFEGLVSELSFIALAGTTYYMEVAQFNDGEGTTDIIGGNLVFNAYITNTTVVIGGSVRGRYYIPDNGSLRRSFINLDSGPVRIVNVSGDPLIAAERTIYNVNGVDTSFAEMMGLSNSQLDNIYWMPWYNNKDLNSQLRFGNVSGSTATVQVFIGGQEMIGSPYTLAPGASIRRSYPGIDRGPVKIVSNVPIVAAERVIYKINGVPVSFSEMMGLPNHQLDSVYWMPWYNSKALNTQLRFANISGSTATVHVYIGGVEMTGSPFTLAPGASTRKSFAGIDRGPVKIESNVNIVAAERVIYTVNGKPTSFSEMMGLPNSLLDTVYWMPWYNNKELNTQLRFGRP